MRIQTKHFEKFLSQNAEIFSVMDKKDRLTALIEYYGGGNKSRFAKLIEITPQGLSTWISRNTFDIELVYSKCEGVSAEWLLTGEGEMLCSNRSSNCSTTVREEGKSCSNTVQSPSEGIVVQLLNKVAEQAEEIGRLKERAEDAERRAAESAARAADSTALVG